MNGNWEKCKWKTIKFEDFGPPGKDVNFEGLIGIEECTDYKIVSKRRPRRVDNETDIPKKRKNPPLKTAEIKKKKIKLETDKEFQVDEIKSNISVTPSKSDTKSNDNNKKLNKVKPDKQVDKKSNKKSKKKRSPKDKKVEVIDDKTDSSSDDDEYNDNAKREVPKDADESDIGIDMDEMVAWSQFGIPQVILRSLSEQKFITPTSIQELTLPAAMLGRRDILGAAETGSGKTLAFGIPILSGILQLKENSTNELEEMEMSKTATKSDPFEKKTKIINMNKLTLEERRSLMKKASKKNKNLRFKVVDEQNSDMEDNSEAESIDFDEDHTDTSDEEKGDSEKEDLNMANDDEDEEDEGSEENDTGIESNESETDVAKEESDVNESDFEEREEETNGVNEEGIGCVKVIDNIDIPMTEVLVKRRKLKPLYALILTPTRELAIQVKNHLVAAAKHTDIRIAVVVGGMAQVKQERMLKHGPEIVVATPGRLWEMIQQGNDHLSQVTEIRYLAIDETDRMIERGHFEELHLLLDRINDDEQKRSKRQNFVFSATLTMVHELPRHLKGKKVTKRGKMINKKNQKLTSEQKLKQVIEMLGITDPKIVDVTTKNQGSSNTLTECRIMCPLDHKDYYLYYVLQRHPGRTIVFCNSIGCVKRLAQLFGLLQCKPLPIHANMQQRQRLKNLDKFRDSPHGLLVATDVAARGLDIPNVEHVIHYQVPRTAENYVHRSGRTARASKEGITILIMEPGEVQNYMRLCRTLSKTEDLPHFPVPDALLSATKQRVNLARELDLLELKSRKTNSEIGWYEKAMKDMDIVLDEKEMPRKMENDAAANLRNTIVMNKKMLTSLLGCHLFPKGFSFKFPTSNNVLDDSLSSGRNQNALQAMKSAMETGLIKKIKKETKNQAFLNLPKESIAPFNEHNANNLEIAAANNVVTSKKVKEKNYLNLVQLNPGERVGKNKWKKMNRRKANEDC